MILHIPHSSTKIPENVEFLIPIENDNYMLTDLYTDDLFDFDSQKVVFEYSRIFCDVERFVENEPMEKYGMGFVYEKNSYGKQIRFADDNYKEWVIENFYNPHHQKLKEEVDKELEKNKKAMILDCHSFPDIPFPHETDTNRPDFCIGSDDFHTPPELVEILFKFIEKEGYTVSINSPYSGSIVPIDYYNKNKNVKSVMIEINRKLYLDGNNQSETYQKSKTMINNLIRLVKGYNDEIS